MKVAPKKYLGQHFLIDENVAKKIAEQYQCHHNCAKVLEIGPGMGALTKHLITRNDLDVFVMEIDDESVTYLNNNFPELRNKIYGCDFLKVNLLDVMGASSFGVVGNFPYNISSQILFKCIEFKNQIPEIMGMFQKEVAQRVAEKTGSKTYGILSVLLQTYYDIEYCFTVNENVFNPPPKVKSGVIRCTRNERKELPCSEQLFKRVVKTSFNQRRKTIRNSLKPIVGSFQSDMELLSKRPEQLSVDDFIQLTLFVERELEKAN
ncbi:MAG: 16S rRNA (adenine(1518)-N(6)/adenine(1519)-N(6))-dimethyltransferase RsmA [Crocinitomicaceae bacterium]|nr:16S rRNA (adenine(1518)-N(6)/adenine(1519)-N(6))-dimethyltransferase RsmA [Crocinitomicaceae bacterium]